MFFCGLIAHSSSMLDNIQLSGRATVHLSIHGLKDILGTPQSLVVVNKAVVNIHVAFTWT